MSNKKKILLQLSGSYLYQDVLELVNIKKPDLLMKLPGMFEKFTSEQLDLIDIQWEFLIRCDFISDKCCHGFLMRWAEDKI